MPVLNPATHMDRIAITVNLAALNTGAQGFGILLLGTNLDLGGSAARTATFSSLQEVQDAFDATEVSAWVLAAATEIFGQSPSVPSILVGNRDVSGAAETVSTALDAVLAANPDFYYVCIEGRDDTSILSLRTWVNAQAGSSNKFLGLAQSDDSTWETSGLPSGLTDLAGTERIAVFFHGTDAEPRAEQVVGKVAGFDPDERSVPWNIAVTDIGTFTAESAMTQTKKAYIRANYANVVLPMGSSDTPYCDPGINCAGRAIYEMVTADWLEVRLREALADLFVATSAAGLKIPVNASGQQQIAAELQAVLDRGVAASHIEPGYLIQPQAITNADRTARRMRFTVSAQNVVGALTISLTVNLSTSPVQG